MNTRPILFVGAGRIGMPIVRRMIAGGLSVHVNDANKDKLRELSESGVTILEQGAISRLTYHRAVLCLPDPEVSFGLIANWIKHDLPEGAIVADITTMSPSTARRHFKLLAGSGGTYLDTPVTGGQLGAESGDMVVIVGGPRNGFDEMLPTLNVIGNTVHYAGPVGSASMMKAVNQYVYLSYNRAFAEGLRLGRELALPEAVVMDTLRKGAAGHPLINDRLPATLRSGFRKGFLLKRCLKDLECLELEDSSQSAAVDRLRTDIRRAVEEGFGDLDIMALSRTAASRPVC